MLDIFGAVVHNALSYVSAEVGEQPSSHLAIEAEGSGRRGQLL